MKDEPWHQGTEVVALYNFPGRSPEDLAFQKGDLLIIQHGTRVSAYFIACNSENKNYH